MRKSRRLALGASILASLAIVGSMGGGVVAPRTSPRSSWAPTTSTSRRVVAEIYAQALEAQGFTVDRAGLNIGERPARLTAFESGQINLMPEYVGFGLEYFTQAPDATAEVAAIADERRRRHRRRRACRRSSAWSGIDATRPGLSAGQDTNAAVVRPDTAEQLGLAKMSDLAAVQDRAALRPAARLRDATRPAAARWRTATASPGRPPSSSCCRPAAPRWRAPWKATPSTSPGSARRSRSSPRTGWLVLEDDLKTQPPGNLVPVVRNDLLAQVDGGADAIAAILDPVSSQLTTEVLTEMGVRIAVDQEDIEDVAADFLAGLAGLTARRRRPHAAASGPPASMPTGPRSQPGAVACARRIGPALRSPARRATPGWPCGGPGAPPACPRASGSGPARRRASPPRRVPCSASRKPSRPAVPRPSWQKTPRSQASMRPPPERQTSRRTPRSQSLTWTWRTQSAVGRPAAPADRRRRRARGRCRGTCPRARCPGRRRRRGSPTPTRSSCRHGSGARGRSRAPGTASPARWRLSMRTPKRSVGSAASGMLGDLAGPAHALRLDRGVGQHGLGHDVVGPARRRGGRGRRSSRRGPRRHARRG